MRTKTKRIKSTLVVTLQNMTINRSAPEKFNRTLQANAREIQASLSKPHSQAINKTNNQLLSSHFREQAHLPSERNQEQRDSTMMMRPPRQSKPTTAHRTSNNNNNLEPNPPRSKPLTEMNRHPATTASQMTQQQQQPHQEVWNSTEDLFWDHMREVQNKWNTLKLNDDIWAKLIYFEQNRRLAKAYVSTPVLTIDGSTNGLDGFRIGLSGIENSYRNLDSIACLRSIGQGIKLKIDQQGNILIRKLAPALKANQKSASVKAAAGGGGCPVWVKEWPNSAKERNVNEFSEHNDATQTQRTKTTFQQIGTSASSSANSDYSQLSSCSSSSTPSQNSYDSHRSTSSSSASSSSQNNSSPASIPSDWLVQEIGDPAETYKLFDMQKFRLQLERTKRRAARNLIDGTTTTPIDWRQCVSIISFDCARPSNGIGRLSRSSNQPPVGSNSKQQQQQVLSDPCWLMLINIIAIDMLKSSVCDSTPSPSSQTSSLVNRYQNDNLRAAARKLLPPLPNGLERPVDDERAQSGASLPTGRNHQLDQAELKSSNAALDQVQYKSQRLKRLNQFRYQAQPEQVSTSLSGGKKQQQQLQSRAQKLPQSRATQPEGSIYTTFTGKYLDKQHRMRADKQRRDISTMAAPDRQSSVDDFDLERGPHLVMSKLSRRDASYQNNLVGQGDNSRPIGPTDFMRPGRRLPSNWLPHSRLIGARHNHQQLTHSLSAFDLSHGLKLNLSSINASPIKMNFDDDDDEEEEFEGDDFHDVGSNQLGSNLHNNDHDDDRGLQMASGRNESMERGDRVAKLNLKPKEKTLVSLVRSQQKTRLPKGSANNSKASSEWIDLAKKFSLIANSNDEIGGEHQSDRDGDKLSESATEQDQFGASNKQSDCEQMNAAGKQHNDSDEVLPKSRDDELEGDKLQQNMSRSSIASSSSGCVDNDYFISQSSPSSMSSSTRSNGEELSSQPASSSGIISGGASDDYERRQMKLAVEDNGPEVANEIPQDEQLGKKSTARLDSKTKQHKQQQQNSTSSTANSRPRPNDEQSPAKMSQKSYRSPNMKQAISLSRGYNGKSVAPNSPAALEVDVCKDCEHLGQTVDQCDCGASACDQMAYAVHSQEPSGGICDCFCDCLYQPNEALADDSMGQQQTPFVHPARCQDELLCDCGQLNAGSMSPSCQLDEEEPIYDHLPRFGVTSSINERPKLRTTTSNKTRHKLTTQTKSSGKGPRRTGNVDESRETINGEDYDCIVPLPVSDRNNSRPMATANGMDKSRGKSISATNLKRTSGWLEGSKYAKLLPRYLMSFASSSSSTSSNYANEKQDKSPVKSGTLDRATQMVNKFRRTRSSQNLSK